MNTQLRLIKSIKSSDNLLFLTDYNDLAWAKAHFSASDIKVIEKAAKNKVPYIFIPAEKRDFIIQFLEKSTTLSDTREHVRVSGNDILSPISHYKIQKITISNYSSIDPVMDYVEGMILGNYQFLKYFREKNEKEHPLKEIRVQTGQINKKAWLQMVAVLEATCKARDLVNEPQSFLSAEQLSREIIKIAKTSGFKVKVFDKKKIEELKMGGLLAVNKGSTTPPTFNILEWSPKNAKNKKPIVLVGKGIVYDTGGMSLKSTPNSMDMMKCDMAGAATVVGTISAIAKSNLPLNIIALVPSTDNRPGNNAYVPGDVITMHSGDSVEVMNTDAEGRLILADALHYAKRYKPELVLDFATLTGAAVRAIGKDAICYMGNTDKSVKEKVEESGYDVYERLIEFPLWKEYGEQLKSNIADLKNLGGPMAGMITAGKFLEHFTDYPWLHFDIAGSAYLKTADAYRSKEGTGVGVRLMFDFLKKY